MNQDVFTALLKQFTRFIDHLTEEDIVHLSNGKKRLSIELLEGKQSSDGKKPSIDLKEIEGALTKIDSRNEAEELLKDFKKADLLGLAKILDVPVQRHEDITRLKEKIIESTIGFKLRSQAIQGGDG